VGRLDREPELVDRHDLELSLEPVSLRSRSRRRLIKTKRLIPPIPPRVTIYNSSPFG